jgi:hypothetical protein
MASVEKWISQKAPLGRPFSIELAFYCLKGLQAIVQYDYLCFYTPDVTTIIQFLIYRKISFGVTCVQVKKPSRCFI